jgi:hypothetical protein
LNVYDLSNKGVLLINKQGLLIDKEILVYILSFKGITVRDLRLKYTPARKIDLEIALTYSLRLIKRINYKARDLIKFKRSKGLNDSDLFLNLLFNLFY